MNNCDLDHTAERPDRIGANIIDFRAARAALLVDRCKGPPREASALIHALLRAGAKTFPVCIFAIPDADEICTWNEVAIDWDGHPSVGELLLAERIARRLGYSAGTHVVGNGGFIFLSVAA